MTERHDPVGFAADLRLSHHLNDFGASAPRVFGTDPVQGVVLVEDFDDATYAARLNRGHDKADLYKLAVEELLCLHHDPRGHKVDQPRYDLVPLLQDAGRDLSPRLMAKLFDQYRTNAPDHLGSVDEVRQRYALLGAQRHARILGVFVRLCQRDAKPHYLKFMPRIIKQFQTALADAGLSEIASFLKSDPPSWAQKELNLGRGLPIFHGVPNA